MPKFVYLRKSKFTSDYMASLTPISGALGDIRAGHLLRRATFGPTITDFSAFAQMTADDAITALYQVDVLPDFPIDPATGTNWISPNGPGGGTFYDTLMDYSRCWWMEGMRSSGVNMTHKMMWFYYTHFPMIGSRIEATPQYVLDYLRLLHHYALGNYKDLVRAIIIDNAMLIHLDGNLNVKSAPQENFAREFLELFTVGKGDEVGVGNYTNFTEQDVQAATKVFTGWGSDNTFQSIDPITLIPRGKVKSNNGSISSQHDVTDKQFSAAFNNTLITTGSVQGTNAAVTAVEAELDDFVDMIFQSPHTAVILVRRIYRQFVYFDITPEIETDVIQPLADVLRQNNYEITSVFDVLFKSEHFYDEDTLPTEDNNIGAIIKSPMEIVISTLRLCEVEVPDVQTALVNHYGLYRSLLHQLHLQGLEFLEPYDVAGHDPYFQVPDFHRYWISSNYLANRYKFAEILLDGIGDDNTVFATFDPLQFVLDKCSNPANATILVQELVRWFLPITLTSERFDYFKVNVLLDQLSETNWAMEWNNYVSSQNDMNVRIQIEKLFIALMQSPEYQLF